MPNIDPPPRHVDDLSSPIWLSWFNSVYESLTNPSSSTVASSLPAGGSPGQVLYKSSSDDYAAVWGGLPEETLEIPSGGLKGQVLYKLSDDDYDIGWLTLEENTVLDTIDGSDAPLTIPQTYTEDGGDATTLTFYKTIDGG